MLLKIQYLIFSGFLLTTVFNFKITEVENKIPNVSSLASKSELTTFENKISDVSNLVTKTNYNKKISEIERKINNHNHDMTSMLLLQHSILYLQI